MKSKGTNNMSEGTNMDYEDLEDDYLDGDYMSDEYYDVHYCRFCGLEMTLDEYLEHDLDVCMEDYYEDDL